MMATLMKSIKSLNKCPYDEGLAPPMLLHSVAPAPASQPTPFIFIYLYS